MLTNLLSWFKYDVGEGAFDAVFGFLFVFCGITLLVLIFTLLGLCMKKFNARKPRQKRAKKNQTKEEEKPAEKPVVSEGITPELVAVITAAIAACYESENTPCEFVVRRIKKL